MGKTTLSNGKSNSSTLCLRLFFTILFFVTFIWGSFSNVLAKSQSEADASPVLTFGQVKTDSLSNASDEKWFKFDVTDRGRFRINLKLNEKANPQDINSGWDFKVYRKGDLENALRIYKEIKDSRYSEWFGFAPDTYYICVCSNWTLTDSNAPVNCPFDVMAEFQPNAAWEQEKNDIKQDANAINTNNTYYGSLYCANDVDWYKYTVTKAGYQFVTFIPDAKECDKEKINDGWKYTIYEADGTTEVIAYDNIISSQKSVKLPMKKGTYYIRVSAHWDINDASSPVEQIYNLKVYEAGEANWETEHNDSQKTANVITFDKKFVGSTYHHHDEDWYKFIVPGKGTATISFAKANNVNTADVHDGWKYELFASKSSDAIISKDKIIRSASNKLVLSAGTYYLKVSPSWGIADSSAPTDCQYTVKIAFLSNAKIASEFKKSTVKISAPKVAKKKVTIKWAKNKESNGYEVYRATKKSGKYTKIATVKGMGKVSYVDKKAKAKQIYFYKVRAYKVIDGKKVYSKYSAIKKVKAK